MGRVRLPGNHSVVIISELTECTVLAMLAAALWLFWLVNNLVSDRNIAATSIFGQDTCVKRMNPLSLTSYVQNRSHSYHH